MDNEISDYLDDLLDQMFEERLLRGRRDTRARKEFARWLAEQISSKREDETEVCSSSDISSQH